MLFFGHVATSLLIADATDSDRAAAIAGALTPDIIDKTTGMLGLTPTRWLAHGLPFFVLACIVTRPVLPLEQWRAYVLGHAGHLACDLWAGSKVPWFAPFEAQRQAKANRWPRGYRKWAIYLLPELIGGVITSRLLAKDHSESTVSTPRSP